jgi:16S rRNA (cytosine967-C5)-methyltransferase
VDADRTRRLARLVSHAGELSALLLKSPQAPDALASDFLRRKKNLAAADRRFISEAAFITLRVHALAVAARDAVFTEDAAAASPAPSPHALTVLAALVAADQLGAASLAGTFAEHGEEGTVDEIVDALAAALLSREGAAGFAEALRTTVTAMSAEADAAVEKRTELSDTDVAAISRAACAPRWILESFARGGDAPRGMDGALRLARALLQSAPVGLRVNRARGTRDDAVRALHARGVAAHAGALSPVAVVLDDRVAITTDPLYAEGALEIQDEGSQLIACALAPEHGQRILDACAGAGGKTLHIADLQGDAGVVLATDTEPRRLRALLARARRCGFASIETLHADVLLAANGRRAPDWRGSFASVLVDAPCSGLGTARRNPLVKWRLAPRTLERIAAKQRAILDAYAAFVRPGGTLVYATCSLLPQENEDVARDFLAEHPDFVPASLSEAFRRYAIDVPSLSPDAWMLTLSPDLHGTDGFFIARMKRAEL